MHPDELSTMPIGIFDSGIGGLTVTRALVKQLPKEHLVYFGDTAHLPYGDKSTAALQAYSVKIAHMLLQQNCKLILIACSSASVAAYDLVKEYVGSKALVMNVVDPTVHFLKTHYAGRNVGLIGTRQTVNSHLYKKKLDAQNANVQLQSQASNLLAQAIEEFGSHPLITRLLEEYLSAPHMQEIEALVLACTHYPVIKQEISAYYNEQMPLIDPSEIVAKAVASQLERHGIVNKSSLESERHFYVSDYTETFTKNAKLFFNESIHLEHYPLWD